MSRYNRSYDMTGCDTWEDLRERTRIAKQTKKVSTYIVGEAKRTYFESGDMVEHLVVKRTKCFVVFRVRLYPKDGTSGTEFMDRQKIKTHLSGHKHYEYTDSPDRYYNALGFSYDIYEGGIVPSRHRHH